MAIKYDYKQAVYEDCLDFIRDWKDYNEVLLSAYFQNETAAAEHLEESAWTADSVTGNGSGSYTFSAWQAEENLCHNLELLQEALAELGEVKKVSDYSAEWADVTIRCYLLPQAMRDAIAEIWAEEEAEAEEEEDEE